MTCHVHHNAYSNNTNNTSTSTNNTNNNNCSNHTTGQPTKINMDDKTTIVTSVSPKFTPSTSAFSSNANITTIPNNYQTSINIKSNNNNNAITTTTTSTSTITSKNTTTIPSNITIPNNTNKVVFAAGNITTSAATAVGTAAATLTRLEYIPIPPKTTTNTATIITTLPTSASTPTTTTLRLPPIAPLTTTYNNNNNHQHHQHHQHQYHNHNTNNNNHSNNSTIITTDITSTVTTTTTNTTTTTGNSCGNNNTIINNYNNEDEDDGDDDDEDDDIDDDDIENSNDTYDTTVHGGVHSLMDHTGTVCGDSQNTTSNGPVACTTGHIVGHMMKRDNASITGRSANSTRNLRARSLRDSILRLTTQPKNRLSASKSSSRAFTEKVRYKRKTLQMMSRPLKRWLQENSKNPYPSRAVKQTLAKRSQMTLTQVSNWFANMRRRLKNTVPCRDGSWSTRITKYNDFVEGNAERFSDWSDGDSCDDTDTVVATDNCITFPKGTDVISESYSLPRENSPSPNGCQNPPYSCLSLNGDAASSNDTGSLDSYLSHPKFKQTILQRYLNDHTGYHVDTITSTRDRRVSGSLCSRDYEEMSTTSSSSRANGNNPNVFEDADSPEDHEHFVANGDLDIVDKEVNAIITLTTMAQSRRRF
ncbi:hypothetical protein Ahia01_000938500 [Argonauta hians]